jgi:hypothetical protein
MSSILRGQRKRALKEARHGAGWRVGEFAWWCERMGGEKTVGDEKTTVQIIFQKHVALLKKRVLQ